ncbi:MAG TPA: beta-ketoacyl-[acyl-carrier-protein] synthase family protein [Thermoanaerobaculia bacterium]|nr:beta-ketoacyl-[acyl-carrier-protein] synthase family protein [Thermoanaerobaculia bacterium]
MSDERRTPGSSLISHRSSFRDVRVAITGLGIVSPLGRGRVENLQSLRGARSGIRTISVVDPGLVNCRIAGEVPGELTEHRGHDRFTRFALLAAEEAAAQAGDLGLPPERIGVLIGTGLGGAETLDVNYKRMYGEGGRPHPLGIPTSMYNAASSAVSAKLQAKGVSYAVVSACASSAHAIGLAAQAIRTGQADAVFAGGADAPLSVGIVRAWEVMRVLAVDNEHPDQACRPFSADRKGLVLAEGAAVLVLESFENARKRGAEILGEIAGFGATSDAGHVTDPSADGAARAMRLALDDAQWNGVDYINAHGTGTRANDATETVAIHTVFGENVPPVSSTKSLHGHAMGASGSIEIAASLLALRDGFLPPTLNLITPDPACDLDYVPNQPRETRASSFLSNSFGFGGMNAVVAVTLLRSA